MVAPKATPGIGRRRIPSPRQVLSLVQFPKPGLSRLERRLRGTASISDLRELARRAAPGPIFDYVDGGAGDETAVRRNEAAFRAARFIPRTLRDVSAVDPGVELLGRRYPLPIVLGPIGLTRSAHADGEIGAARAAGRAGIPYTLSTMATESPEKIAQFAPDAERWFQLYLWKDHEASQALLERALAAGFTTLVFTVDVAVAGDRHRDVRNGLTFPPSVPLRTALRIATRPRWWFDAITRDPLTFAAIQRDKEDFGGMNRVLDAAATFEDLEWLRGVWPGRIIVKGVVSPADAIAIRDAGADGIIVSNHGGRQLDQAIATLDALPAVRAAVGDDFPLLIDGGIRTGGDIAVALAAGADAVMIGRAYVYGLMAGGEAGADRAIELLGEGLRRTMALLGARTTAELTRDLLAD